jgi:hypothetical protein
MNSDESRIAVLTNEVNEYREQAIVVAEHNLRLMAERDAARRALRMWDEWWKKYHRDAPVALDGEG